MTRLYATAARGTADLVAAELRALGLGNARYEAGGAHVQVAAGTELEAGMRACLHLRVAMRVLWPLANFSITDGDQLYEGAKAVAWEDHLTTTSTFAIAATTSAAPPLAHAPFLGLRVKDAIADRLTAKLGSRPNVARQDPDVQIYLHLAPAARGGGAEVTVGLDLSGESLHLRGYRVAQTAAPLRETLAAAVIAVAGWEGAVPFIDPLCGSGTIAIEAALRARRIAPGLTGVGVGGKPRAFGFLRWPTFGDASRRTWDRLVDEARGQELPRAPAAIHGSDRDTDAVGAARRNAAAAGVAGSISFAVADVRDLAPLSPPGVVFANPPYGERLGTESGPGLLAFWRGLGIALRKMDGHQAFIIVPSAQTLTALGLRPTWERKLMNGPLPIKLARFELGHSKRD